MENASKALLIAGAILLVIAIIAIGMTILGQGQDVVDQTGGQIGALAITAHNEQFGEIYTNARISGKDAKDIIVKARNNNQQSTGSRVCEVTISGITDPAAINPRQNYWISAITYDTNGAINAITISATDPTVTP